MTRTYVESVLGPRWIRIRLQKPPHHGLTVELCQQLFQVLDAAAHNPEVRAILFDSYGPSFCVGADLKWVRQQGRGALGQLVRSMNQVCQVLLTAPKPVLCSIGGVAAGGGMALALCADIRVASHKASFRLAYPQVGLCPDGGCSFRLQQLIGLGKTQEWLFQDRLVSATEAHQVGLVHQVVHPDRLEETAWKRLETLAAGPTLAYGESKSLLNPPERVREALEREAEAIERLAKTEDCGQALQAFLSKQIPVFEGR